MAYIVLYVVAHQQRNVKTNNVNVMPDKKLIKYPVKLGFSDNSGKDENWITDANGTVICGGWGDCCKTGGIQHKHVALAIVRLLNKHKPRIYIPL